MISIRVQGADTLRQQIKGLSDRRLAAAVATALTRTAVAARKAVQAALPATFDRPTPYTVRQVKYVGATAAKPVAAVGFNVEAIGDIHGRIVRYAATAPGETPASVYLQPQIEGGRRGAKRLEVALRAAGALPADWFAVPGQGAKLDAFGNMSRGQIIQVLSQLRIQLLAGSQRNLSDDARSQIRAQRRAGGRFFVVKPGAKIQPGVYQREFFGRNITPVLIFVRSTNYRKRFDFDGLVNGIVSQRLTGEVQRAIAETTAKAFARQSGGVIT